MNLKPHRFSPGQAVIIRSTSPTHCLIPCSIARIDAALERPDSVGGNLYRVTGIRAINRGRAVRAVQCLTESELDPLP